MELVFTPTLTQPMASNIYTPNLKLIFATIFSHALINPISKRLGRLKQLCLKIGPLLQITM